MGIGRWVGVAVLGVLFGVDGALAQNTVAPEAAPATPPNAQTPPDGVARGVVPPPRNLDPAIVTPPAADVKPTMPVIKPPAAAR